MKSYIKLLTLGAVLAGMTSCTDLDTPLDTKYTTFPDSEIATSGEFSACYYYIRNEGWVGRNYWEVVFLQGDEAMGVNFAGNYFDNGRYLHGSIHALRDDTMSGGQMGDLLSGCSYTNTIIMKYGGAELNDPIVAPLRAIRAFYHFLMMDMYGDAPILDHVMEDGEIVDRAPRADVARWIEKELLEAIPDLTEDNNAATYGRPNKWMAEALLVKLYLNWGVYTHDIQTVNNSTPNEKLADCVNWCNEIIKSGVFEVGQGYRKKFYPDNGVHIKDFIYAVPFDPLTLGNGYWGGWQPNRFWDFRSSGLMSPGTWGWNPYETPAGTYIMTPEAVDRFCLEGDERNDMIAVGVHTAYDANYNKTNDTIYVYRDAAHRRLIGPLVYEKTFEWNDVTTLDVGAESTVQNLMKGARCYKYPPRESDYDGRWDKKGLQENDLPVFRYADILLSKAECLLRGASDPMGATVASLVNEVRDCAHAPHVTGSFTLQDLLDERSREFIMEMWRRQDLIRYGAFENDWGAKHIANPSAKTNLGLRLMPIPRGNLETNTNWSQNPGY